MADLFITNIHINKVRHLENVDIPLSKTERKHLILTGINGSGKTSVLEAMRDRLYSDENTAVIIDFNKHFLKKDLICAYLSAKRREPILPTSIEPVKINDKELITTNASIEFLKYILFLDYRQYLAKSNNDTALSNELALWFSNFVKALRDIYECPDLRLFSDADTLSFMILIPGREPFRLQEMSDGYRALLEIYFELLMRFGDDKGGVTYDTPAIVLIDEIETHLHVELQKKALPFLTKMFPNTQFIVTTHSPFVITSVDNAVVFDLENKQMMPENLTDYSYSDIVEGYFNESENSEELDGAFNRYVALCKQEKRTKEDGAELMRLYQRLINVPANSRVALAFSMFERKRLYGKREEKPVA